LKLAQNNPEERLDAFSNNTSTFERHIHLSRYNYAANYINSVEPRSERMLIDAACGLGYGSYVLSTRTNAAVHGTDISHAAVRYATANYALAEKITFTVCSITQLPFDDNLFDFFICFETIEHLRKDDAVKALTEMRRVLKSNGFLLISSPNRRMTRVFQLLFQTQNPFHLCEYTPRQLYDLITAHGFVLRQQLGQFLYLPLLSRLAIKVFPAVYLRPSTSLHPALCMIFLYSCQVRK